MTEIIGIVVSVGAIVLGMAATWGALRVRIKSLETSRADMGRRIGALERIAAFEEGRAGRRRPSVAFKSQPEPADESGPEEGGER